MVLYEFLQFILAPLGLAEMIISPVDIINTFSAFTWETWGTCLSPNIVISSIIYIMFTYAMFFIIFVVPFRFLKKWIKVPNAKGD